VEAKVEELLATIDEDICTIPTMWHLKRNTILEIRKGVWFLWHSK
jgi:hypothetical protein